MSADILELMPVNVGHGNYIVLQTVIAMLNAGSLPVKRLRDEAKKSGRLIDATEGRKTRAVIVFASGHVLLSANAVETLTERWQTVIKQKNLL